MERISGPEWAELLRSFQRTAWRWECQGEYREPDEERPFREFLDGGPVNLDFLAGWLADVRANVQAGKHYGRVRVLTDPLTDYLRFELSLTRHNIEAGEDVRVMTAARAQQLRLPTDDFWLLDDTVGAVMHFGPHGFTHADVVRGTEAERLREIRATAWHDAVPFHEYMANR